jgi:hypothetical protein
MIIILIFLQLALFVYSWKNKPAMYFEVILARYEYSKHPTPELQKDSFPLPTNKPHLPKRLYN